MVKFHSNSDFHLPQSQNCLLGTNCSDPVNFLAVEGSVTCPAVGNRYGCDPADCTKYYHCNLASDPNPAHMPCAGGTYCTPALTVIWDMFAVCTSSTCPPPANPPPVMSTTAPQTTTSVEVETTTEIATNSEYHNQAISSAQGDFLQNIQLQLKGQQLLLYKVNNADRQDWYTLVNF